MIAAVASTLFEATQLLSILYLLKHNALHKSVSFVSTDFSIYLGVWKISYACAGYLYTVLETVHREYAARYTLFPNLPLDRSLAFCQILSSFACVALLYQMCWKYKRDEPVSMLCGVVLAAFGLLLSRFSYLCYMHRATINLLDMADLLSVVGSISFAVRFIPQISVNWFNDRGTPLHRHFFAVQSLSLALASFALLYMWWTIPWYDIPVNLPGPFGVVLNWIQLAILVFQRLYYSGTVSYKLPA